MFGATQRNRRRISSDWAGGAGRAVAPSVPARYWISRPASDRQSRLTVWRNQEDLTVAAFEFLLKDSLVR